MSFQQIPSPELGGIPVLSPQVEIWVADHSVHHKEVYVTRQYKTGYDITVLKGRYRCRRRSIQKVEGGCLTGKRKTSSGSWGPWV